ncbi:MAG: M48 family metallopeptidase [Candidatus Shapirobacteria bacterium]
MRIKVKRSLRRRKTISAHLKGGIMELHVPYFLSAAKINYYADLFARKLRQKDRGISNTYLKKRADLLAKKYSLKKLPDFQISWSLRQQKIFGVCDSKNKKIRISARLKKAPSWVIDYLILHEAAHLIYSGHGKDFWQAVNKYPKAKEAKAFLKGVNFCS